MSTRDPWEQVSKDVTERALAVLATALAGVLTAAVIGFPSSAKVAMPAIVLFVALIVRVAWPAVRNVAPVWLARSSELFGWGCVGVAVILFTGEYRGLLKAREDLDQERTTTRHVQERLDKQQQAYSDLAVQLGAARQEANQLRDQVHTLSIKEDASAAQLRAQSDMADLVQEGESFETEFDGMNPKHTDPVSASAAARVQGWHARVLTRIGFHYGQLGLEEFQTQSDDRNWMRSVPWNAQERAAVLLESLRNFLKIPGYGSSDRPAPMPIR